MQVAKQESTERQKRTYAELEKRNTELETHLKQLEYEFQELREKYDLLLHQKFARSAEKLIMDSEQQLLFAEEPESSEAEAEAENKETQTIKSYERKKAGRKPLDPSLPRKERIIDIPEEEKTCACGATLTRIGEESNEKLQIIPPRIYVEKTIRPKYACRCCEGVEDEEKPTVRMAPVEPSIIPKSIVSPSLLSTVITQKYEMHLPYYRQEKQFDHIGVHISRQDMSNWQQQAYEKLKPLFELLKETVKKGPVIQMDETTVLVMGEEGREDTDKSYMWLARGGPPDKKVVWYEYHPTRKAEHAKQFLEGYSGYLQTDGYSGYDSVVSNMSGIIHVGCFAHARRKFFEASKANKKAASAEEGMKYIRNLYQIEETLRNKWKKDGDTEKFLSERKTQAGVVLKNFKAWLDKRQEEVPPSMLLGKAIGYTLNQWGKLIMYLESPYLTPDNNACENAIRPFVIGRKNWLFNKSPLGAESSCGMFTLIETAKQQGLVPFEYLMAIFEKAPFAHSLDDWQKLLPWNCGLPLN
jgi:transposase